MNEKEKNIYKNLFEYPTELIANLELENEQLKKQYSKLEEKYLKQVPCCNEDDCDLYRKLQCERKFVDEAKTYLEYYLLGNYAIAKDCQKALAYLFEILEKAKGDSK